MNRCAISDRALTGAKWPTDAWSYYYINNTENLGVLPDFWTTEDVRTIFYNAAQRARFADNSCNLTPSGMAPKISYSGTTTSNSNINGTTNQCASGSDGKSVIDFRGLSGGTLAYACWRHNDGVTCEADIRFDSTSRNWSKSVATCSAAYDLPSVATHEFGHFIGLAHVSERGRADLSMSVNTSTCDASGRAFGLGDVRGWEALG